MSADNLRTCSTCQNDLVCHDQGECLRPTPETDAYKGTHETHRIGGKTIYGHAEHLERQRDEALELLREAYAALSTCHNHCYSDGMLHHQAFDDDAVARSILNIRDAKLQPFTAAAAPATEGRAA